MSCRARIRGIPEIPAIQEVNVRSRAQISAPLLFKAPVGLAELPVLEIQPDAAGAHFKGKVYQWLRLHFPDQQEGWIRDDLLEITGPCAAFGYGDLQQYAFAFTLSYQPTAQAASASSTANPADTGTQTPPSQSAPHHPVPQPLPQPTSEPVPAGADTPSFAELIDHPERVRKAAFEVTAAFEGHGYAAYQNYDRGIISYGRFQFALTGGLPTVIERYAMQSGSPIAQQVGAYLARVRSRDESLRQDLRLRDLLIAAAEDPVMRAVQDQTATELYWNRVLEVSVRPRGIQSPLALAMLFDIGIQYGVMHGLISTAEQNLGVPGKSKLENNGIREQQLMLEVARIRKHGLYAQAERENLPGLRPRADFWLERISSEDWAFVGDADGNVIINGRRVQIRNPK